MRIKCLNGYKQIVDAIWFVFTNKHFTKVGILKNCSKRINTLCKNFFSMSNKKQSARLIRILFSESFIIKCRDNCFTGSGSRNNKIAIVTSDFSFCIQFIENFLLI